MKYQKPDRKGGLDRRELLPALPYGWASDTNLADLEFCRSEELSKRGRQIVMLQRKLNRRHQEAELIAGIIALAFKTNSEEVALLQKRPHCVGDLDLANRAGFRSLDLSKDIRR